MQNAECLALFPLPLAHPGFYPASLTNFVSCIPASACPGADSTALAASYSTPALAGAMRWGNTGGRVTHTCSHLTKRVLREGWGDKPGGGGSR